MSNPPVVDRLLYSMHSLWGSTGEDRLVGLAEKRLQIHIIEQNKNFVTL
jgi:hypothetical protein